MVFNVDMLTSRSQRSGDDTQGSGRSRNGFSMRNAFNKSVMRGFNNAVFIQNSLWLTSSLSSPDRIPETIQVTSSLPEQLHHRHSYDSNQDFLKDKRPLDIHSMSWDANQVPFIDIPPFRRKPRDLHAAEGMNRTHTGHNSNDTFRGSDIRETKPESRPSNGYSNRKASFPYRMQLNRPQQCGFCNNVRGGTRSLQHSKHFKTPSMRQGVKENERWRSIIAKLAPFLDVHSLLMLRQTCVALYFHNYALNPRNELCFRGFAGYDTSVVIGYIFPLISRILGITDKAKLVLDFGRCCRFRDISVVRLWTTQAMITDQLETQQYCRNMRELILDYCSHITDKALEVMLTTKLPNLEKLSIVCCRNESLTGSPFMSEMNLCKWPRFTKFNCSFSNIGLEPIQAIAGFIVRCAAFIKAEESVTGSHESLFARERNSGRRIRSCCDLTEIATDCRNDSPHDEIPEDGPSRMYIDPSCQLEICGSWGSRLFLDKHGFGPDLNAFAAALRMKSTKLCSRLTKRIQRGLQERSETEEMSHNSTIQLLKLRGSEFLVNCPIIEQEHETSLEVWTLPISIAIRNDDMEMFNLLIRRGARVNVWDYCGKSPLYNACDLERTVFVKMLLKLGQAPEPIEDNGFSPLAVCIQNDNSELLGLLLKAGAQVNVRCPHIRAYKSPLYIACEAKSEDCIQMLLDHGADPNWLYHGKISPTITAYHADKNWLPIFVNYGAGRAPNKRFILTDVLSCAVSKGDVESVTLLVDVYPDLLECEHDIWSKPAIQAARLGQHEVLHALLDKGAKVNQTDSARNTALHVAAEDNRIDCVRLLINYDADVNAQDASGHTPLYLAVMEDHQEVAKTLLLNGCDPNLGDFANRETPLMAALRTRNEEIAMLIINKAAGLRYDAVDRLGRSSCIYSLYFEQYAVGEVILDLYESNAVKSSATEIRWFSAVAHERLKSKAVTHRELKQFVKRYRLTNAQAISDNGIVFAQTTKWPLMHSLLGRKR